MKLLLYSPVNSSSFICLHDEEDFFFSFFIDVVLAFQLFNYPFVIGTPQNIFKQIVSLNLLEVRTKPKQQIETKTRNQCKTGVRAIQNQSSDNI